MLAGKQGQKGIGMMQPFPFVQAAANAEAQLRLMATTDLHMHLFPFDYLNDRATGATGLARAAAVVGAMRAGAANSLLLDNGDFLQGSAMGDYIAQERGLSDTAPHPMILAMNRMGYDAATLGNHEFNFGVDFLVTAIAGAGFPVVSANLVTQKGADPGEDRTLVPPYCLIDRTLTCADGQRRPIKIGIIGFLPPQTAQWDRDALHGRAETRDIVESARAWVPRMRAAGADLVIALAHSGIGALAHEVGMENAATALAAEVDVDVVIAGHSHLLFPSAHFNGMPGVDAQAGKLAGKPAVMAGACGSHVGAIDLLLSPEGNGWAIRSARTSVHPVPQDIPGEGRILAVAATEHAATRHYMARCIGRTETPLYTHFAMLTETPALRLICDAQAAYVRRNLAGTGAEGLPLLSAAAPFKVGGRGGVPQFTAIPAGPLSLRNIADLYTFPNTIRAVRVTGAEVAEWLERAAAAYLRVSAGGRGQPLFDPGFPSYNFDMISGISYHFDLSAPPRHDRQGRLINPAGGRLRGLLFEGRPVDPAEEFVVATNNYRVAHLAASGMVPRIVLASETTNREVLVAHVEAIGRVAAPAAPNWAISLPEGTSVEFDTGPGAMDAAPPIPCLAVESLGPSAPGLIRLRLRGQSAAAAAE